MADVWTIDRELVLREYATVAAKNYSLYLGPMERTADGFRLFAAHPSVGVLADVAVQDEEWVCRLWRLPAAHPNMDVSLLALHVMSVSEPPQGTVVLSPALHAFYLERGLAFGVRGKLSGEEETDEGRLLDTVYAVVEQMRANPYGETLTGVSPDLSLHSLLSVVDDADLVASWGGYAIRMWVDSDEAWMHVYPRVSRNETGKIALWSAVLTYDTESSVLPVRGGTDELFLEGLSLYGGHSREPVRPDEASYEMFHQIAKGKLSLTEWTAEHVLLALASFTPRLFPSSAWFSFRELVAVEGENGFTADPTGYESVGYRTVRARNVGHARYLVIEEYPSALFDPFPITENRGRQSIPAFSVNL